MENIGICKGAGDICGQIHIGSDSIFISKIGKYLYTQLNKRSLIVAKSKRDLSNRTIPVLSTILRVLANKTNTNTIKWKPGYKNYTKMFEETLKDIEENIKPYGISMFKMKPDEVAENAIIEASSPKMAVKLNNYIADLGRFGENISNVVGLSESILGSGFDKKVWGSKEVLGTMNPVKTSFSLLSDEKETVEGCLERSDQFTAKLQTIIDRKLLCSRGIVGKIIDSYSILKSFLSETALVLHPLTKIDSIIMASTGYPATWFINSSVLKDFIFEYDNLINNLIKLATIEKDVIEPLFVWKVKMMGECHSSNV